MNLQEWADDAGDQWIDPGTLGKSYGTKCNYVRIWGLSYGSTQVGGNLPSARRVDPAS